MRISDLPDDMQVLLYQFADDTGWIFDHPQHRDPKRFGSIHLTDDEIQVSKLPRISLPPSDERYWKTVDIKAIPPIVIAHGSLVDGRHRVWLARKRGATKIKAIDASPIIIKSKMDKPIGKVSRNPAKPKSLSELGVRIRKIINSKKIFSLLPFGDWGAGGCWVLARAIQEYLGPSAEIVVISEEYKDRTGRRHYIPVTHFAVEYLDTYFDYLGAQDPDTFIKNLERGGMKNPQIHAMTVPAYEKFAQDGGIDRDYYTKDGESVKDVLVREFHTQIG